MVCAIDVHWPAVCVVCAAAVTGLWSVWCVPRLVCRPTDRGMDMAALKLYLLGRKGLDVSLNTSRLTLEFTDGFYGQAAAGHVRRYTEVLAASMLKCTPGRSEFADKVWTGDRV